MQTLNMVRRLWANRNYRLLFFAGIFEAVAAWVYLVAIVVLIWQLTGSPTWVAASVFVRMLPYVLFSSLGGIVADRYDRKKVIIIGTLTRVLTIGGLAAAAVAEAHPAVVLGIAFVSSSLYCPVIQAYGALMPNIVPKEDLATANSLDSTMEEIGTLVGSALGGAILLVMSPGPAFLVTAAGFGIAALIVSGTRVPARRPVRTPAAADTGAGEADSGGFVTDLREGWQAMRSTPGVLAMALVFLAWMFMFGMESVLFVLVAEQRLELGAEGLGFMYGAMSVGAILAAVVATRFGGTDRPAPLILAAALCIGIPLVVLAFTSSVPLAVAALILRGAGATVLMVLTYTQMQRILDDRVRGRVGGLVDTIMVTGALLASALAPLLLGVLGLSGTMVVAAVAVPLATVLALPALGRVRAELASRAEALAPRIALLEQTRILEGASTTAVETLAADLTVVPVITGQHVVTEGEAADAIYVIVSGRYDVISTGEEHAEPQRVRELGPGEYFGEIGVLQHSVRTASIVALTDGELYRIDADEFVHALSEAPAFPRSLNARVAERLGRTHPTRSADVHLGAPPARSA